MGSESGRTVGVILAGGSSSRFGAPKGLAEVGGEPILGRILTAHRQRFDDVVLVVNDPGVYRSFEIPMIPDLLPARGPVSGIHAALRWAADAGAAGICCTPCDAPFVRPELFDLLLVATAPAVLAVIPRSHGPLGFEPLFAWYSTRSLPLVEGFLLKGGRTAHELVSTLPSSCYLPVADIESVGAPELLFLNVNTPEDLMTARSHSGPAERG